MGSSDDVSEIWGAYLSHHPKAILTEQRKRLIRKRLKEGFTSDALIEAIHGCHQSPWHCGDNPQGRRYQSIELILRSAEKVEQFVDLFEEPAIHQKDKERHSQQALGSFWQQIHGRAIPTSNGTDGGHLPGGAKRANAGRLLDRPAQG